MNVVHKKGEIVQNLDNALKVNCLRNEMLDVELYISNNRLYKKLNNGHYRALVLQERKDKWNHYFLRNKDKKKLTINADKLFLLTFVDPKLKLEVVKADSVEEPVDSLEGVLQTPD
jgi:hypothetical protein